MTYAMCQFMLNNDIVSQSDYQLIFLGFSYLLPLSVISGLYVRMIMRLWRQSSGVRMSVESQRGRKRVTRLVVVVVIAFALLWLPIQVSEKNQYLLNFLAPRHTPTAQLTQYEYV